ncbi:Mitogen-activated protein kinase kinase kinase YODA [Acorus gramineus]|uniref:Mitogen-activated protein kinase kinase kinase YODA n=1 Tax=Acorus gramineus TaxID=55184 RepID=A0AAV9A3F8_ACOGR|nr:Mitogen-activated protein kinase kinase kinase YODA [Acorus gramineus]
MDHANGTCEWTRGRTLGRGSSAVVSLASDRRTGSLFAVKSADLPRSGHLQREFHILSSVSCPRVVSCLGEEVTFDAGGAPIYNLFMEYVPRGTISDEIRRRGGHLDERDIRRHVSDVLRGLDHLHASGIVHCDIKGANLLLEEEEDGRGVFAAKIADLGCARLVDDDEFRPISGTPAYMAPEVARGEEQGPPADVWALGCTIVEMTTGRPPWTDALDAVSAIFRIGFSEEVPEIPAEISEEGKDFLRRCLERDPKKRWTAEQLMKHAFVNDKIIYDRIPKIDESPKCVLERDFWDAVEDEEEETSTSGGDCSSSPTDRIGQLCVGGPRPSMDDEDWITVRSVENDEGEQLIKGEDGVLSLTNDDENTVLLDGECVLVGESVNWWCWCSEEGICTGCAELKHNLCFSLCCCICSVSLVCRDHISLETSLFLQHMIGFVNVPAGPMFGMHRCSFGSIKKMS